MTPPSPVAPRTEAARQRLQYLSRLLDNAIAIPGTEYRVGIDPLLGLVPGGGDLLGGLLSAYILLEAAFLGLPKQTLLRMAGNILLETVVGTFPVVGDFFDVTWKANARNYKLIEAHLASPQSSRRADTWFIALLVGGLLVVITLLTAVSVILIRFLWQLLTGQ